MKRIAFHALRGRNDGKYSKVPLRRACHALRGGQGDVRLKTSTNEDKQ